MRLLGACLIAALVAGPDIAAQTRRPPARPRVQTPPKPVEPVREVPAITCPAVLGTGVKSQVTFCDVMSGTDPAAGILIPLPPHQGDVILTFDLHNRHTYSEEQVKANRAFARYTASIGVMAMDNTLISRAAIQTEFRTAADLLDRIGGGAGPAGVKAVAPTGVEHITITIPEVEEQVSLLGERLTIDRADGTATYTSPGRPIAVVSNLQIEYRPLPPEPPPPPAKPPRAARPAPRNRR